MEALVDRGEAFFRTEVRRRRGERGEGRERVDFEWNQITEAGASLQASQEGVGRWIESESRLDGEYAVQTFSDPLAVWMLHYPRQPWALVHCASPCMPEDARVLVQAGVRPYVGMFLRA